MFSKPTRLITALAVCAMATQAQAHEGHGLFGPHWHATDTLGFVALVVGVGAAIWLSRK